MRVSKVWMVIEWKVWSNENLGPWSNLEAYPNCLDLWKLNTVISNTLLWCTLMVFPSHRLDQKDGRRWIQVQIFHIHNKCLRREKLPLPIFLASIWTHKLLHLQLPLSDECTSSKEKKKYYWGKFSKDEQDMSFQHPGDFYIFITKDFIW